MWGERKVARRAASRIVFIYICISISWIFISDYALNNFPILESNWIEIIKGSLFILVSAFIFYYFIQKGIEETLKVEGKYRLIVENVSDLIAIVDRNGIIEYTSPSHEFIFGFTQEELTGKSVFDFLKKEDRAQIKNRLLINEKVRVPVEINLQHKEGHLVLVECKAVPILDKGGVVERNILFSRDITERKNAEKELMESEERYRKLVEYSPETTLIHMNGIIIYVNQAGLDLIGAGHVNQIIGKDVLEFIPKEDTEYAKMQMGKIQEGVSEISEYKIIRLDGKVIYCELLGFVTTYKGENAVQVIVRDVTERKKAAEQVEFLAYHDSLTGIPNRNSLYEHLDELILCNDDKSQMSAVMFLDLDRFKMINDTFGHSVGDILLKQVTIRLNSCLKEGETLYRYGGDEYVIIMQHTEHRMIKQLAENLIHILTTPFIIQDRQMFISTSIGISLYPNDGDNVEALIQNADTAMYYAKEKGKNDYHFYTDTLHLINNRKMEIENGIRRAIDRKEFALYYQPQVDLNTKKIDGLEVLIRWKHPEYGFISPMEFIPIAEETGLISLIGNWVLETACHQYKQWLKIGIPLQRIAVNVSSRQFKDKTFVKAVRDILHETKLDPSYLELEITESVTQQVEEATIIMKELKKLGVHLSIDDFGTGYSSLNYLRQFPIDKLKIDKSFVGEINNHIQGKAIVRTIIELGNNLGFKVIAEGIENEQQLSFLQENNCHFGQGYFFSKPLPSEEIGRLLMRGTL